MKYIKEYRDPQSVQKLLEEIASITTQPWNIMEVCGGQTHSLVRNGIIQQLPKEINMVHGPGCPVCVTPVHLIDDAIRLAQKPNVILCSFGDMLRVPGSEDSLLAAKAKGADVRMVYSPLEAVKLAQREPEEEVVFFAVGFETTAPANALSVVQAKEMGITNYSILTSHVLVPPAIEAILNDPKQAIDGFLAPGHVCTIMGTDEYTELVDKFQKPIVVTGFEPVDLLCGILMCVRQLENNEAKVENQYARMVISEGNQKAQETLSNVFDRSDRVWRGIGTIPKSGYELADSYAAYDAAKKFELEPVDVPENQNCIAGDVLKGLKKPKDCPSFGKECTPENPLGAPMVSSEGACAAYFNFANLEKAN